MSPTLTPFAFTKVKRLPFQKKLVSASTRECKPPGARGAGSGTRASGDSGAAGKASAPAAAGSDSEEELESLELELELEPELDPEAGTEPLPESALPPTCMSPKQSEEILTSSKFITESSSAS